MNCQEALQRLYEFIDKELDQATEGEIKAHLDHCQGCLGKFEAERLFKEMLRTKAGGEKVSEEMRARILAGIESASQEKARWFSLDWGTLLPVLLAAGLCLALALLFLHLAR
jgi:mycothiol system anti-sigma-R factor